MAQLPFPARPRFPGTPLYQRSRQRVTTRFRHFGVSRRAVNFLVGFELTAMGTREFTRSAILSKGSIIIIFGRGKMRGLALGRDWVERERKFLGRENVRLVDKSTVGHLFIPVESSLA